ncbi:MAG: hypothetical protein ACOVPA_22805, partial [Rubrivivax sp.]
MPAAEGVPAWVQEWVSAGMAEWVPPQALLAQQAAAGASPAGASVPVVWLYQAPWAASAGPGTLRLNSWISLQRQALRHRARQPLPWVLVNIDAVNPAQLAEELGLWVADPEDARPAAGEAADDETAGAGLSALWAKLFEWSAPQAWDVYEALEAAAWAAPGMSSPWVRDQLPTPDLRSLEALQKQRADAVVVQARLLELETAKALASANSQQAKEAESALSRAQEQLTQARQEADTLLQQLHQVQEELEQLFLQGKEREAADTKARAELQAAIEQAQAEGRAAAEQAKA